MRFFVYSKHAHRSRMVRGAPTACNRCGVELVFGDLCAAQKSGFREGRHSKIYHKKCYEGTLIGEDTDE
jgi:hypothetical protein